MKKKNQTNKLFLVFLLASLAVLFLIVGQNVYDSLYPPIFTPPKINVAEVKKRIAATGLIPREALFYEVIEKDTRMHPKKEEGKNGQN